MQIGSAVGVPSSYHDKKSSPPDNTSNSTQIIACICTAVFHLTAGIVSGFSAILIPELLSSDSEITFELSDISWITGEIFLVAPVGAVLTGYIQDRIGRANTIRLAVLPYITGWICIATAYNFTFIKIGRLLNLISIELSTGPAIVYITEVARPNLRGTLLCLGPSFLSLGYLLVYTLGALVHWRTVCWISITCCMLALLMMTWLSPESPAWLVSRGRTEQALESLKYLHQNDEKNGIAEIRLAEMVEQQNLGLGKPGQQGSVLGNLLRGMLLPTGYKPFIILTFIFIFQQFVGAYFVLLHSVTFLEGVIGTIDHHVSPFLIMGVVKLVLELLTSLLLGWVGRRPLYMLCGAGMAVCMCVSGYFTKEMATGNAGPSAIPTILVLTHMVLGVIGLMTIPLTMTAEMFPINIRGMAQGLILCLAYFLTYFALKFYPSLPELLGSVYALQWLFAGSSLAFVIFIFVFLPETHRKELAEIQDYFNHNTVYKSH